jgi:hypothetical protein
MSRIIIIVFGLLYFGNSYGQDITSLHLQGLLSATHINPGLKLEKNINFYIGDIYLSGGTDGPSLNSLVSRNAAGEKYFDPKKLSSDLSDVQNVYFNNDNHTFGLSIGLKDGLHLMVGHALKSKFNLQYNKDLVVLAANGNGPYIGQTLSVAPRFDLHTINEVFLGAQKSFGGLTVGAKFKMLYGVGGVRTEKNKINLTTDADIYQLTVDADYVVRSSGVIDYQSLEDLDINVDVFSTENFFKSNSGFGFDLGASYKLGEKLTLSASILDLGKITWDLDAKSYTASGLYRYEGIDLIKIISDSSAVSLEDTLRQIFQIKEEGINYSTSLGANYVLAASFSPTAKWTFNGMIVAQDGFSTTRGILSLAAIRKFKFLHLGLQYQARRGSWDNLGLYTMINAGPVKIFAATDNVLTFARPFDSSYFSGRVGLGLQF